MTDPVVDASAEDGTALPPPASARRPADKLAAPPARRQDTGQDKNFVALYMDSLPNFSLTPRPHNLVSTFVPCFRNLFHTLNQVDMYVLNASHRYYVSVLSHYHTCYGIYYYTILIYIQVMRARRSVNNLSLALSNFLTTFETTYPLSSLPIEGPLVPFFQQICAFPAPFGNYGNVTPTFVEDHRTAANDNLAMHDHMVTHFPDPIAIRRTFANIINVRGQARVVDEAFRNIQTEAIGAAVAFDHANAHGPVRDALINPATMNPVVYPNNIARNFAETLPKPNFPGFPDNSDNVTVLQSLGLDTNITWFGQLRDIMMKKVAFTRGNSTLDKMSAYDGNFGALVCHQDHVFPNRDDHRDIANIASHFDVTTTFNVPGSLNLVLPSPIDKMSTFSNINWIPADNYGPIDHDAFIAATHIGPFWQLAPIQARGNSINPMLNIQHALLDNFMTRLRQEDTRD